MKPTNTAEPTPKHVRRVAFDLARLLAVYAIVWIHTPRSELLEGTTVLTRFAIPFFVFAAIFFVFESLRRRSDQTFSRYCRGRILRIYVPFLVWCVIYLWFKSVKSILLPDQPNDYPGIGLLWTGSFYHLWFMPFILMVSLVAFLVAKITLPRPRLGTVVATFCFAIAVLLGLWPFPVVPNDVDYEYASLIFNATPAVLMGIGLAIVYGSIGRFMEHRVASVLGLILFLGATGTILCIDRDRLLETLAGLGFMLMALSPLQAAWAARIAKFGHLAYGIYLSHLLFIKVAEAVASKADLSITWKLDLGIFLFAAIGSTLFAWALSRWRVTKWLVV